MNSEMHSIARTIDKAATHNALVLYDFLSSGIAVLDSEHRFIYYNQAFNRFLCAQTGLELDTPDLLGQVFPLETFWDAEPEDEGIPWQLESPDSKYVLGGEKLHGDSRLHQQVPGATYLLQVSGISRSKKREPELANAITFGQSNDKDKIELLTSFSHEFRTPLNAVLGFGNLLLEGMDNKTQREYVEGIVAAGSHLLKLVNEILTLSKAEYESADISLKSENIDVDEVIGECIALMQPFAGNADVSLTQSGSSGRLICDRTRLKQVLLNLISNAIKYNNAQGQVVIRSLCVGGRCAGIEVQDNGLGIPGNLSESIFNPFRRLLTSSSKNDSSGLGLMLTRRLLGLMGGRVRLASRVGSGSVFAVDFNLEDDMAGTAGLDKKSVLLICHDNVQRQFAEQLLQLRPDVQLVSHSRIPVAEIGNRELEPDIAIIASDVLQEAGIEELAVLKKLLLACPGGGLVADGDSEGVRSLIELGVVKRLRTQFNPIEFLAMYDSLNKQDF